MYEVDAVALLARVVLRERVAALVAEACAWSVGLSDRPFYARRGARAADSGLTLGMRAEAGLQLAADDEGRLELGDAAPGTFQDALNALAPDGRLYAEAFDEEVVVPFVLETCVRAAERAREEQPVEWQELLDELGEDGSDLPAVVRAADWEAPLRTEAEQLVLAALGHVPLVEVEAEGVPLSLVRAAEAELRRAAAPPPAEAPVPDDELAGALFLADAGLADAGLDVPVPVGQAAALLEVLVAQGLEPDEVRAVLAHLPVHHDTAEAVIAAVAEEEGR